MPDTKPSYILIVLLNILTIFTFQFGLVALFGKEPWVFVLSFFTGLGAALWLNNNVGKWL